eukprot:TRINITY_DN10465_c0_g1_i3.p3 TRINITY_DN10465_c0_g1~~TRINITY_DN10465_c0_g1_i3.p3  ORF type:complete len:110 (-),score=19.57 TRINITY_DN10465_c0_g1_i3:113-442(-)
MPSLVGSEMCIRDRIISDGDDFIGTPSEHVNPENYIAKYIKMFDEQKYNIRFKDDSLLTYHYQFNEDGDIINHTLTFLPAPPNNSLEIFLDNGGLTVYTKALYLSLIHI